MIFEVDGSGVPNGEERWALKTELSQLQGREDVGKIIDIVRILLQAQQRLYQHWSVTILMDDSKSWSRRQTNLFCMFLFGAVITTQRIFQQF